MRRSRASIAGVQLRAAQSARENRNDQAKSPMDVFAGRECAAEGDGIRCCSGVCPVCAAGYACASKARGPLRTGFPHVRAEPS